ncbi:DUF4838 domain-containing protein [Chitinophaga niabensis]|uniref:DUF4838 domain-containing protein n=1 Tax=Chitinophaga niabensis TaxID=536979 RepID=A0A1N6JY94_9BACT|nr:DUF4838 domain-containing protein [Chitinophaga niabensis]SIO49016.1 protein of unknown function [Chitinophaga niabensis]
MSFGKLFNHRLLLVYFISSLLFVTSCKGSNEIVLTEKNKSSYKIVLPASASSDETNAAKVLQKYLQQISGCLIPIVSDEVPAIAEEILIGNSKRLKSLNAGISFSQFQEDGFLIRTINKRIVLAGGYHKGSTYAVYTFLEDYLGCRKFTPTETVIPKSSRIVISAIKQRLEIPIVRFRLVNFYEDENEWYDWAKLTKVDTKDDEWGRWVYEFDKLLPPQTYFGSHPEYFAYRRKEKKRVPDQLCMTEPAVQKLVIDKMNTIFKEYPKAKYWTICQNENLNYCECDKCLPLIQAQGSPQGSLLQFINKIASAFPKKVIATHAYQFSLEPPRSLKPASNVIIIISSITANRGKSIKTDTDAGTVTFRNALEGWQKLTKNIYIWDYIVQFTNFFAPFPNLHTLQPNIQYMTQKGAIGFFEQATGYVPGDFSELKSYLVSKVLWNPQCDVAKLRKEFLQHYYGAAWTKIDQYLNTIEENSLKSNTRLDLFGDMKAAAVTYLAPDKLQAYQQLFDEAEGLVRQQPGMLKNVQKARLPVLYAVLKTEQQRKSQARSLSSNTAQSSTESAYQKFVNICKENNIELLSVTGGDYRLQTFEKEWKANR